MYAYGGGGGSVQAYARGGGYGRRRRGRSVWGGGGIVVVQNFRATHTRIVGVEIVARFDSSFRCTFFVFFRVRIMLFDGLLNGVGGVGVSVKYVRKEGREKVRELTGVGVKVGRFGA